MKVTKLLFSTAIFASTFTGSILALAEDNSGKHETHVEYDNSHSIIEPGDDPKYLVVIPGNITFKEGNEIIETNVTLEKVNEQDLPKNLLVKVSVSSENDYKLVNKKESKEDKLTYRLFGEGILMKDKPQLLGSLSTNAEGNESKAVIESEAKFGSDVALLEGKYTDTLTYSIDSSIVEGGDLK